MIRLLILLFTLGAPAAALADAGTGRALFEEGGCRNCHMLNGKGGQIGPDLTAEGTVPGHDRDWQLRHLLAPAEVTPGSFMPPVNDPDDAEHLADFLVTLTGTAPQAAAEATPAGAVPAGAAPVAPAAAEAPAAPAPEPAKPSPAPTPVTAPGGDAARGKTLFEERGCRGCHALHGEGGQTGPDLTAEGTVPGHDYDWQLRHLLAPAEVTPGSFMPPVADADAAADLAAFLVTLTGPAPGAAGSAAAPAAATPPAVPKPAPAAAKTGRPVTGAPWPPSPGDAEAVVRGQSVYAAKGCGGCHTVRGIGGTLGPDLTFEGEVAGHDADWHLAHLRNPAAVTPGSTMPPFLLADSEVSDLVAYLLSLRHLAADRTLTPELSDRFTALGMRLEALRIRVERARHKGRNVDDVTVTLSEAWTNVGAVEEMMRRQEVTGAEEKIAAAEQAAAALETELTAFENQLRERTHFVVFALAALLLGSVLLLAKIRLLNREWWMKQEAEGGYAWRRPALERAEPEKER